VCGVLVRIGCTNLLSALSSTAATVCPAVTGVFDVTTGTRIVSDDRFETAPDPTRWQLYRTNELSANQAMGDSSHPIALMHKGTRGCDTACFGVLRFSASYLLSGGYSDLASNELTITLWAKLTSLDSAPFISGGSV
jgi:hypothetical protein